MATSNYPTISAGTGLTQAGGGTTSAPRGDFIPQLWSNEILAAYQTNIVIGQLVSRMAHEGKKGDTVNIPAPTRGSANDKVALTGVTLQNANENSVPVSIYKHKEYSKLIEDIVNVQALSTLRAFYVEDAGYAIATRVDRDLSLIWHFLNNGNTTPTNLNLFTTAVIGSDGTTNFTYAGTGNGAALTDSGIRRMMQTLDDTDTPMSERYIVLPPVEKKNLLGIPRFTEQAFTGETAMGNSIRNGLVGAVYGMPVYVTTNCPVLHLGTTSNTAVVSFSTTTLVTSTSGENIPGQTADTTVTAVNFAAQTDQRYRIGCMLHKSALIYLEQMSMRTQTQYKQEYLASLLTADTIYGVGRLRDGGTQTNSLATAGICFVTPA